MAVSRPIRQRKLGHLTSRRIPPSLAPLLSDLELDQPRIVATARLDSLRLAHGIAASTRDVAQRLQAQGWLLPLRTRGVYEFVPAARAGNFSSGDPFLELRGTLDRRPDLPLALAYDSAAWVRGFSRRVPDKQIISAKNGLAIPPALSDFRVTRQYPNLIPDDIDGLPVWQTESLLVYMAARPEQYRDWPNVLEWLSDAVRTVDFQKLERELEAVTKTAAVRLAYLIHRGEDEDLADRVLHSVPPQAGPIYFGANRKHGARDKKYDVIDSLLSTHGETDAHPHH
jgi:hypothetical protein